MALPSERVGVFDRTEHQIILKATHIQITKQQGRHRIHEIKPNEPGRAIIIDGDHQDEFWIYVDGVKHDQLAGGRICVYTYTKYIDVEVPGQPNTADTLNMTYALTMIPKP